MRIEQTYINDQGSSVATATNATTFFTVDRPAHGRRSFRVEDHLWVFDHSGYWKVDIWMPHSGWTNVAIIAENDAADANQALDLAHAILGWPR